MKENSITTLKDVMPNEFIRYYSDTPSYRFLDVEVIKEYRLSDRGWKSWPGTHKNVMFWVELANGKAVGWNENPGRGWSFPVVNLNKDK